MEDCKVSTATDAYTIKLLEHAANEIAKKMDGKRPHVVISNLRRYYFRDTVWKGFQFVKFSWNLTFHFHSCFFHLRSKLDPNREILEAAQGNSLAEKVYKEFHSAINDAKKVVKRGLIIDFHGQVMKNIFFYCNFTVAVTRNCSIFFTIYLNNTVLIL